MRLASLGSRLLLGWTLLAAGGCDERPAAGLVLDVVASGQSTREIVVAVTLDGFARRELRFADAGGAPFSLDPGKRLVVSFSGGQLGRGQVEARAVPTGASTSLSACASIEIRRDRIEQKRLELAPVGTCPVGSPTDGPRPPGDGGPADGPAGPSDGRPGPTDGGVDGPADGARPGDGSLPNGWRPVSRSNAPAARVGHSAVWTGSEMIVWGGLKDGQPDDEGGRYDPRTDTWQAVDKSGSNVPADRAYHTAVWTGSEMIVWGGRASAALNDGARYQPAGNVWVALAGAGMFAARSRHAAVWTGSEMIVWGGLAQDDRPLANGSRYTMADARWHGLAGSGAPAGRYGFPAVWTGSELWVWGGLGAAGPLADGARFLLSGDSWRALPAASAPSARSSHVGVWARERGEVLVWGGLGAAGPLADGAAFAAASDAWRPLEPAGLAPRSEHAGVWTGQALVVWGGLGAALLGDGARLEPGTGQWVALPDSGAPSPRKGHTMIWTGSEVIVWGGTGASGALGDGARYTPP